MVDVAAEWEEEYAEREYRIRLPEGYDPEKPYPVLFYGGGCGNPYGDHPAESEYGDQVILVLLRLVMPCFNTGESSPEIPYFDAALADIEARYCVDEERLFVTGYQSGAVLASLLSCSHGDVLRGVAIASGGEPVLPTCTGPVAGLLVGGTQAEVLPIEGPNGLAAVRDRLRTENGCDGTSAAWDERWPYCETSTGCDDNPVVFCAYEGGLTNGQEDELFPQGYWDFFMALP